MTGAVVEVSRAKVEAALDRVADPCSIGTGAPLGLAEMGLVQDLVVNRDVVSVTLRVTAPTCWQAINIVQAVERIVGQVDGVRQVECVVNFASEWEPALMHESAREKLARARLAVRAASIQTRGLTDAMTKDTASVLNDRVLAQNEGPGEVRGG